MIKAKFCLTAKPQYKKEITITGTMTPISLSVKKSLSNNKFIKHLCLFNRAKS